MFKSGSPWPELEPVRRQLLRRILVIFLAVGLPATLIGSLAAVRQGRWWFALVYTAAFLVGGVLLLLTKRLPYRLGAGFLVATLYALSVSVLLRLGLTGGGIPLLLAFCVLSSLFFDVAAGVIAIVTGALAITVVAAGMVTGFVPAEPRLLQSSREIVSWINSGVVFLLLAAILVMSPRLLLARLAETLARVAEGERHQEELAGAARRRSQDLELLDRVRTALVAELEPPDLFRAVVESIAATFGYTQVSLYTLEPDGLVLRHQVGYRNVVDSIPLTRGVCGRVVRTGLPTLVEDVRADPDFIGAIEGIASEVCVPLFDRDRIAGVLNVESTGGVTMGEADLRLMTNLGAQVGVAVTRARLHGVVRDSEQRYRSLVENVDEGITVVDPDERFVFANSAAEAVFGVPRGTLAGRNLREFLSDEEYARARAETEQRRRGERSVFEQDIVRRDGAVRRIELNATPHYAADGSFDGTFAVFRDITEYRALEQNLEQERGRLLTMINSLPDNAYLKDAEGRFVVANRATAAFLGARNPADLVGRTEAAFLPGGRGEAMLREDREAIADARSVIDREGLIPSADGAHHWMLATKVPLRDAAGRVTGLVGIARDITKRKEAEEKLLNFIDQSPEAILLADEQGAVIEYNASAERISGIPRSEAIGAHIWELFAREAPRDGDRARATGPDEPRLRAVLATGAGDFLNRPLDAALHRPDGTERQVQRYLFPIRTTRGWQIGSISHDMTDSRRTERALRASEEQLAQAQRLEALGRLAGGVAHDFNNVLTVIQGYADLLAVELADNGPLAADVAEIARAARRAADMTSQLLAFSRKQVMEPRVVRLDEVIAGLRTTLPRILGEDIRVQHRAGAGTGSIRVDPGQIERVVLNLAANARDAMPRGGTLVIETRTTTLDAPFTSGHPEVPPGDYVELVVSDTGTGIEPDVLPRIFEPFFTTKTPGRGTGLGLSMAYGIVKQSNGFIYCTSEPGRGTTFALYFPRQAEADRGSAGAPAGTGGEISRGSGTVLVVEDEEGIRRLALTVLAARGYEVLTAADGIEALEIAAARNGAIDLLVTDVVMPRMNGPELAARLSSLRPGIRVLFISGYAESALAHQGRVEPGVDLLQKPFDPATLVERVRRALGRSP
jgi:two-component system, cell cycle sensor histidine kinase and response regulator CckA